MSDQLDDTHETVEEMHAILLQAKGARWVIAGLAGVAGLASGLVAKWLLNARGGNTALDSSGYGNDLLGGWQAD